MGIKERLYKEYVIIMNKVHLLNGESLIGDDIDNYFASEEFCRLARACKKSEIYKKIDYATASYNKAIERHLIEEYYSTEKGKSEKEAILKEIESLKSARYNYSRCVAKEVDGFIKDWLGSEWGCNGVMYTSSLEIGIVKETTDDNVVDFVFGHSFTIYYNDYFFNKDNFEMNYGAMGSFDLLNGSGELRCKYLLGMSKFSNDKVRLVKLKQKLDEFIKKDEEYSNKLSCLSYVLEHPFDNKGA